MTVLMMKMSASSTRSPDPCAVQRAACSALQSRSVSVTKLEGYIFRTYRLRTSEGFFYILRTRPSINVRLLRHEEGRLEAEAGALQALGGRSDARAPRLITYHTSTHHLGSPYLISGPLSGSILSEIEPSLSRQALASIDHSLGQYVRRLSSTSGPHFGAIRPTHGFPGSQSWARAFASILESVMRDGEDALISLPYEGIRDLVRRHRGSLDRITEPKLVLLELGSDRNVVVDPKNHTVNGLLDFSTAIWGDPFMSDCFYRPTASFAQGFGRLPNTTLDERCRQYFYVLYHSLLAIVRQCYRPSADGDEMEARRNLTTAVRQLSSA